MSTRPVRSATPDNRPIVLLDLNFTFVGNSLDTKSGAKDYRGQIDKETYRQGLVELLRSCRVFLVTVRDQKYEEQTIKRVKNLTGWTPERCYFRNRDCSPPVWKKSVLDSVRKEYPTALVMAIESNDANAAMYVENGVLVLKVWGGQHSMKPTPATLFDGVG